MTTDTFTPLAITLLLALTIVLPLLGLREYRQLLQRIHEGRADARFRSFVWTIVMQWGLTLGFMVWWILAGGELGPLRLLPTSVGLQWLAIGAGLAIVAFLVLQMVTVLRSPEKLDEVRLQTKSLSGIAPQSVAERRAFALMAITAGICEEILYRGLLIAVLAMLWGTWPAVIVSSAIFGLGHAYQGLAGIGKTAAAGILMALLAVGSGSLFVPMLIHAIGDLTSGRLLEAAWRPAAPAECA